jgi:hypothetical protein
MRLVGEVPVDRPVGAVCIYDYDAGSVGLEQPVLFRPPDVSEAAIVAIPIVTCPVMNRA